MFRVIESLPEEQGSGMSDEDDFQHLLGDDVQPLKSEKRVALVKGKPNPESLQRRRQAAQIEQVSELDPLAGEPMEMVEPLAVLSFQRPGVQHGVFRNLRLAKYPLDAQLDLHSMTVDQARREVYQFVRDCIANDVRTALVTHGKGEGREQPAVLKSCVAFWLPQIPEVLAFHSAQKRHGGYGATYILLRKSEREKTATRERHNKHLPD